MKLPAAPPPDAAIAGGRVVVGPEGAGKRLDVALAAALEGVSRSQVARHIAEGAVTRQRRAAAAPSQKVRAGDVLSFQPAPARPVALQAEDIPLQVVHEDRWLLVIDKPAGLVVHPAPGHEGGTLVNALLAHCKDLRGIGGELRPGIVHRLDRGTSGLMVVAKDDATLAALGADFKVHRILRQYEALVVGAPGARQRPHRDAARTRSARPQEVLHQGAHRAARPSPSWRVLERLPGLTRDGGGAAHRAHPPGAPAPHLARAAPSWATPPTAARPAIRSCASWAQELGRQALHAKVLGFHHPATGAVAAVGLAPAGGHRAGAGGGPGARAVKTQRRGSCDGAARCRCCSRR